MRRFLKVIFEGILLYFFCFYDNAEIKKKKDEAFLEAEEIFRTLNSADIFFFFYFICGRENIVKGLNFQNKFFAQSHPLRFRFSVVNL